MLKIQYVYFITISKDKPGNIQKVVERTPSGFNFQSGFLPLIFSQSISVSTLMRTVTGTCLAVKVWALPGLTSSHVGYSLQQGSYEHVPQDSSAKKLVVSTPQLDGCIVTLGSNLGRLSTPAWLSAWEVRGFLRKTQQIMFPNYLETQKFPSEKFHSLILWSSILILTFPAFPIWRWLLCFKEFWWTWSLVKQKGRHFWNADIVSLTSGTQEKEAVPQKHGHQFGKSVSTSADIQRHEELTVDC